MLGRFWHSMCVMSPSAGTGAGGLHMELYVPSENHRAYSVVMNYEAQAPSSISCYILMRLVLVNIHFSFRYTWKAPSAYSYL
jgi:hypothetical protein